MGSAGDMYLTSTMPIHLNLNKIQLEIIFIGGKKWAEGSKKRTSHQKIYLKCIVNEKKKRFTTLPSTC